MARSEDINGRETVTVGDVLLGIETGKSVRTQERPAQPGELAILRVSAVTWGTFRPEENKAILPDYDPGNCPRPANGDILISRANTRELVGAPVIVEGDYPHLLLSDKILRLVPDKKRIFPRYLARALRTNATRAHFEGRAGGTSGSMTNITQEDIRTVPLALPPLPEQKRIAAILDKADGIRRKRQEAIRLTEELLRAAFLEMFGDPVTNPKGWEVKELNDFISPERPITYGILKPGPDIHNGVPYVRVVDIQDGEVNVAGVRRTTPKIDQEFHRSRLLPGDLLMSIRGHVGRLAVVPPELKGANITQDTARLAPVGLDASYVMGLIQTPGIQFWMARHVRGVAVRGINIGDVRRIPIPVPPASLQKSFASLVKLALHEKSTSKAACQSAQVLADSLTQSAFSGLLR